MPPPDHVVGRVVFDGPRKEELMKAAIDSQYKRQAEQAEERALAYRKLLGAVYSYCASDIRTYGGPELDREVRAALGLPASDE